MGVTREFAVDLGKLEALWDHLTAAMSERYRVEPMFVPARGKSGAELKYKKAGRTLITLLPQEAGFIALVVLGGAESKQAFELDLGRGVRRVLEEATQYHDGRWLFVPVKSKRDVRDLLSLIALKRRPDSTA